VAAVGTSVASAAEPVFVLVVVGVVVVAALVAVVVGVVVVAALAAVVVGVVVVAALAAAAVVVSTLVLLYTLVELETLVVPCTPVVLDTLVVPDTPVVRDTPLARSVASRPAPPPPVYPGLPARLTQVHLSPATSRPQLALSVGGWAGHSYGLQLARPAGTWTVGLA